MKNNENIIITEHERRDDLVKDPYDNLVIGIGEYWGGFYRENPHRFVLDYLQIGVHPFQQFLLYEMNKSEQSVMIATRGKLAYAPIL